MKNGRLIVFDQDEDAYNNRIDDPRVTFVQQNFRHMQRFLKLYKSVPVDGILADLGFSRQFDTAERGFSTRFDGDLDMRMDKRTTLTAAALLQSSSEKQLQLIFQDYGEVTNARTLAKTIAGTQGKAHAYDQRIQICNSADKRAIRRNIWRKYSRHCVSLLMMNWEP